MAFGDHIQSIGVDYSSGTSGNISLPGNLTAGNILYLAIRVSLSNPSSVNVSGDTLGHTWTFVRSQTGTDSLFCFCVGSCQAGANTVTFTISPAAIRRAILAEYTGPGSVHGSNNAGGTGGTLSCGLLATTLAPALLLGAGAVTGVSAFSPAAGYTERQEVVQKIALEDQVVGVTGNYTPTMTVDGGSTWLGVGAAFVNAAPSTDQRYPFYQRPWRRWRK